MSYRSTPHRWRFLPSILLMKPRIDCQWNASSLWMTNRPPRLTAAFDVPDCSTFPLTFHKGFSCRRKIWQMVVERFVGAEAREDESVGELRVKDKYSVPAFCPIKGVLNLRQHGTQRRIRTP